MKNIAFSLAIIFIALGDFCIGAPIKRPKGSSENKVVFESQNTKFSAVLSLPNQKDGTKAFPAVIFIHDYALELLGSPPPRISLGDLLAAQLNAVGIAVFQYSLREQGYATLGKHVEDLNAALAAVANCNMIDSSRIGIIAHGCGNAIAARLAAESNDLSFVVALAPNVVDGRQLLIGQVQLQNAKGNPNKRKDQVKTTNALMDSILYVDTATFDHSFNRLPFKNKNNNLGSLLTSPWMKEFINHYPGNDWSNVSVPVLAVFAKQDQDVCLDQNRALMEDILKNGNTNVYSVITTAQTDHFFHNRGAKKLQLEPKFIEAITKWIANR